MYNDLRAPVDASADQLPRQAVHKPGELFVSDNYSVIWLD
jgi:hypothetical protein